MAYQFKSELIGFAFVILGCASLCLGQGPLPTATATPQHQKMGYFAGDWKLQGTMKIGPNVPGGPFTSTEHGEGSRADSSLRPTPPCIQSWVMFVA